MPAPKERYGEQGQGELRESATMNVAMISGATFTNKSVVY